MKTGTMLKIRARIALGLALLMLVGCLPGVSLAEKFAFETVAHIPGWSYGEPPNAPSVSENPGNGAVTYTYFTDENCTKKTTAADGAAGEGLVPTYAGDYWIQAEIEETDQYSAQTATSSFTIFPIEPTADLFKVSISPDGVYSGQAKNSIDVTTIDGVVGIGEYGIDRYEDASRNPIELENIIQAGSYNVIVAIRGTGNYGTLDALQVPFLIRKKGVTVTASDQEVLVGENIATGVGQATLSGAVQGHKLSSVTLTSSGTDTATTTGTITAKDAKIVDANGNDVTDNYDISYTKGKLKVAQTRVTISGLTVTEKAYDGTTKASFTGTAELEGVADADQADVTLVSDQAKAEFADKDVGKDKDVTFSGFTLTGAKADHYALEQPTGKGTINPCEVKVSGITAKNKTYDGGTAAELDFSGATFTGLVTRDTLTVTATGTFADAAVGDSKTVTISGLTLDGASKGNYKLAANGQQDSATAKISKKQVTITVGNQTVKAGESIDTGIGQATLSGALDGHTLSAVTLTSSSTDAITDAGTITPSGAKILDADRNDVTGNYDISYTKGKLTVTQGDTPVTIIGLTVPDKAYDGTVTAAFTGTPVLSGVAEGDEVTLVTENATAEFADKDVGKDKNVTFSGFTLAGAKKDKYVLAQPTGLTGTITPREVVVGGITAKDKIYDGTATAELDFSNATFTGLVTGDTLTVTATGAFADAAAGDDKTVTISDLALAGESSGNYKLATEGRQTSTTAKISKRPVKITAKDQQVKAGEGLATGTQWVAVDESALLAGHKLESVKLTASEIEEGTTNKTIIASDAKVLDSAGNDVTGSYQIAYIPGKLTAAKQDQTAPAAPKLASSTVTSITLATVSGCEYSMDQKTWQDSPVFSGLTKLTEYTFYQRYKETTNANASPASAGTAISTPDHAHEWSYSAEGTQLTGTCADTDGAHGENKTATLTIIAPTLIREGKEGSPAATISGSIEGVVNPAIVYTKDGAALTAAPETAGTYTASITLGTATAAVTYTIQAPEAPCTITFDANGGTGTMEPITTAAGTGVQLTKNAFTKEKNVFAGWNTMADGTGTAYADEATVTPAQDMTLYAQWKRTEFTVLFDAQNIQDVTSVSVTAGQAVSRPKDPALNGYRFLGWYLLSGGTEMAYDFSAVVTDDITLVGRWEYEEVTLTAGEGILLIGPVSGLTFSSATTELAGVTADGQVIALQEGAARIEAYRSGQPLATYVYPITVGAPTVTLNTKVDLIEIGSSATVKVDKYSLAGDTLKSVVSNKPDVATVTFSGDSISIKAVAVGVADVTVTTQGGATNIIHVSVFKDKKAAKQTAFLDKGSVKFKGLGSVTVGPKNATKFPEDDSIERVVSEDKNVATATIDAGSRSITITAKGITEKNSGKTTINVYSKQGRWMPITVTVKSDGIKFSPSSITVTGFGKKTVTVKTAEGDSIKKVTSDDKNIATATFEGNTITVKTKSIGVTWITVITNNGGISQFKVNCKEKGKLHFNHALSRFKGIAKQTLSIKKAKNDPEDKEFTAAESSNEKIATARLEGDQVVIESRNVGTTYARVLATGDLSASVKVTVGPSAQIKLEKTKLKFKNIGESQIDKITRGGPIESVESSDESVATATFEGNNITVTSVGYGTANIWIRTTNNDCSSINVTVNISGIGLTLKKGEIKLRGTGTMTVDVNKIISGDYIERVEVGNEKIATATFNGNSVTAHPKNLGSTEFKVITHAGATAILNVIVTDEGNISFGGKSTISVKLDAGKTTDVQVTAYSLKDKGIRKVVSDDKSIAKATFKGDTITIKGLKQGKTNITVYGHQTSAILKVTVN